MMTLAPLLGMAVGQLAGRLLPTRGDPGSKLVSSPFHRTFTCLGTKRLYKKTRMKRKKPVVAHFDLLSMP